MGPPAQTPRSWTGPSGRRLHGAASRVPGPGGTRGSLGDTGGLRGRRPPSACGFASWKRQLCSTKRMGEILEKLLTGQASRGADWEGRAGESERSARRRGQGREGTPSPCRQGPVPSGQARSGLPALRVGAPRPGDPSRRTGAEHGRGPEPSPRSESASPWPVGFSLRPRYPAASS